MMMETERNERKVGEKKRFLSRTRERKHRESWLIDQCKWNVWPRAQIDPFYTEKITARLNGSAVYSIVKMTGWRTALAKRRLTAEWPMMGISDQWVASVCVCVSQKFESYKTKNQFLESRTEPRVHGLNKKESQPCVCACMCLQDGYSAQNGKTRV